MKNLFFVLLAITTISCGPKSALINFDDLTTVTVIPSGSTSAIPVNPGDQFNFGDIIVEANSGIQMIVLPFQWQNKQWTTEGHITIDADNKAEGGGNEIHFNNACLGVIDPSGMNIIRAKAKFADYGGNINLIEKDTVYNNPDFTNIASPTLSGLNLSLNVAQTGGAIKGTIELSGSMSTFIFPGPTPPTIEDKQFKFVIGGGQELWIDDLEFFF
ncbi:MAG: hypothetical protein JNK77_11955 [Saprospiraceae bacterium]|nr:hypothetical protein [Saprospiraceae bacterium]